MKRVVTGKVVSLPAWTRAVDPSPCPDPEPTSPPLAPRDWPSDFPRHFARLAATWAATWAAKGLSRPVAERMAFARLDGVARRLGVPEPAPMAWRIALAGWPAAWRQAWGQRANELDDGIRPWREAERLAFAEVSARRIGGESPG